MEKLTKYNINATTINVLNVDTSNYRNIINEYDRNQGSNFGNIISAYADIVSYFDKENGNPYASARLYITFINGVKLVILFRMEYNTIENLKHIINLCVGLFSNVKDFGDIKYFIRKNNEKTCLANGSKLPMTKELVNKFEVLTNCYFIIEVEDCYQTICRYDNIVPTLKQLYKKLKKDDDTIIDFNVEEFIDAVISRINLAYYNKCKVYKYINKVRISLVIADIVNL